MLTTIDNPFDPFTQFEEWNRFDIQKGYHTCAYLARITVTDNDLIGLEESSEIESSIDEILKFNLLGIYKKVTREVKSIPEDSE